MGKKEAKGGKGDVQVDEFALVVFHGGESTLRGDLICG